MKILTWAVRLIIFLFLFAFAVQNTDSVNLHFVLGQVWHTPLVMVLLIFFAAGALLGMLTFLSVVFRQHRQITQLKRDLNKRLPSATIEPPPVA